VTGRSISLLKFKVLVDPDRKSNIRHRMPPICKGEGCYCRECLLGTMEYVNPVSCVACTGNTWSANIAVIMSLKVVPESSI